MNRVETIQERLQRLPAKAQEEVLEALEQIEQRYQTKESLHLSKPEDEFEYRIYKIIESFSPYFSRLVNSKEHVEDLTHEVYLKFRQYLLDKSDWQNEIKDIKTYIYWVAVNEVKKHPRKYRLDLYDSLDSEERWREVSDNLSGVKAINDKLFNEELHQILKELLQDFSEYEEVLITMRMLNGYETKEIAAILKMDFDEVQKDSSRSWIKFRNRALKILKNKPTLDLKRTAPDKEFEADMIIFAEGTENISHINGAYSRQDIYFDHD